MSLFEENVKKTSLEMLPSDSNNNAVLACVLPFFFLHKYFCYLGYYWAS